MDLWVEKYRPRVLEDVVMEDATKEKFRDELENKQMTHYLFAGKPGTGKTTLAKIIITAMNAEALILNASDERGIQVIRDKIRTFARTSSFKSVKLILLDEADGLTADAMFTLRGTMEEFSRNVRFILTANYPERIIEAIRSRVTTISFGDVPRKNRISLLVRILESEKIEYDPDDLFMVDADAEGDMRKAINLCQGMVSKGKLVYSSLKDKVDVSRIWDLVKDKNWQKLRSILDEGLDSQYILEWLFDHVFEQDPTLAVKVVGEYLYRDSVMVNKKLNLLCCCVEISQYCT